jgi:branched-chain amino acid aminotransferase
MREELYLNFNGKMLKNEKPLIFHDNRSFRYGDGCFETMKLMNGKILLEPFHLERLFTSLQLLQFNKPNFFITDDFLMQIKEVAKKNQHKKLARVRVTVFRGNGGLYDTDNHQPNYIIETMDLNSSNNKLNENGLVMDVFKDARRAFDKFSHIKSNNYLQYVMAAMWAKENKLNDALILNSNNNIADATIANVFVIQDGIIKTPALTEACVSGVMRKFLLKRLKEENYSVQETSVTVDDILNASEVFLTNAIYGMRWVKEVGKNNYKKQLSEILYKKIVAPNFL